MRDLTRVFVFADTDEDARRLAEVFRESAQFLLAGVRTATSKRKLKGGSVDVIVFHTRSPNPVLPAFKAPLLLLGSPVARPDRGSSKADAILPPGAGNAQIRAAAQAIAVGLRIGEARSEPLPDHDPDSDFQEALTDRELEVLNLLAEGFSNPEIARQLAISRNTVKFHVSSIIGKLAAASRTEAVTEGLRRGLIII